MATKYQSFVFENYRNLHRMYYLEKARTYGTQNWQNETFSTWASKIYEKLEHMGEDQMRAHFNKMYIDAVKDFEFDSPEPEVEDDIDFAY